VQRISRPFDRVGIVVAGHAGRDGVLGSDIGRPMGGSERRSPAPTRSSNRQVALLRLLRAGFGTKRTYRD
jgi:hypothetical protein